MNTIKAILFDRDETVSYDDPKKLNELADFIDGLLGKPGFFNSLNIDDWRGILYEALDNHHMGYFDVNTVDKETFIWKEFFKLLLEKQGLTHDVEKQAGHAFHIFNILEIIRPYPESEHVFSTLKKHGYLIGIVSNCFPTLRESLTIIGLDTYVDCFVNSSSVGSRKPDHGIFKIALDQLGVRPRESIFIDNLEENVIAAREFGITAFHIDRGLPASDLDNFKLNNLSGILHYLGIKQGKS